MGTNYYLVEKPPCVECGRAFERKHIGKSSGGWCFSLHVIPDEGINDLADWRRLWLAPGAYILDEYGTRVESPRMLSVIIDRGSTRTQPECARWYSDNHAAIRKGRAAEIETANDDVHEKMYACRAVTLVVLERMKAAHGAA